jgi:hypothetical protein
MDSSPTNSDYQKIIKLIYSGVDSNDIIAFEIIKQLENSNALFLPLISIYLSSVNQNNRKNIYDFLKSNFSVEQEIYFTEILDKPVVLPRSRNILKFWINLKPIFQNKDIVELCYLFYKRLKKGIQAFLILDNGIHPNRREIFEAFLNSQKQSNHRIKLEMSGLFPDEMKEYADLSFSIQASKPYYILILNNLKSSEIPSIILSKKINKLEIQRDYQETFFSIFPSFIFNFKQIDNLTISINNQVIFPKNWSRINGLKELSLIGKKNEEIIFSNLDFLDSIPSLVFLTLKNHQLSHPELLLQKKKPLIFFPNPKFESLGNYEINLKTDKIVSNIANALKRSNLSYEDQQYYFKRLLALNNVNNISSFPTEELLILEKISCSEISNSIEIALMFRGIVPPSRNN